MQALSLYVLNSFPSKSDETLIIDHFSSTKFIHFSQLLILIQVEFSVTEEKRTELKACASLLKRHLVSSKIL